MQWWFLQSLEGTAVLHFNSMMGAFGGHANHGDASRYALHAVQMQSLAHVQVSCASPIKHLQDVTSDDRNWVHLLYPLGRLGSTPFVCRTLFAQHSMCSCTCKRLCLFYLRVLTHMQKA